MFSRIISERTTVKYALMGLMRTLQNFEIINPIHNKEWRDWNSVSAYINKYGKYPTIEEFFED